VGLNPQKPKLLYGASQNYTTAGGKKRKSNRGEKKKGTWKGDTFREVRGEYIIKSLQGQRKKKDKNLQGGKETFRIRGKPSEGGGKKRVSKGYHRLENIYVMNGKTVKGDD